VECDFLGENVVDVGCVFHVRPSVRVPRHHNRRVGGSDGFDEAFERSKAVDLARVEVATAFDEADVVSVWYPFFSFRVGDGTERDALDTVGVGREFFHERTTMASYSPMRSSRRRTRVLP